jgi:hypothetical protein
MKKPLIQRLFYCGEGEIRTLGSASRTTVFETAPFNHSGTSPEEKLSQL